MKLGILTLPLHTNYGGILQAYALQSYLKKKGHDVWVIDLNHNQPYYLKLIKELINFFSTKTIDFDKGISSFIKLNIYPRTEYINLMNNVDKLHEYGFDAYVVGSDQVWREEYCREIKKRFFLDFIKNKEAMCIAYAASFGIANWSYDEKMTAEISALLNNFDAVSVRESSAVALCREKLQIEALNLIDPTMLLQISDYVALVKDEDSFVDSGELLTYILDESDDKKDLVKKVSEKLGYNAFSVNFSSQKKMSFFTINKYPSVITWLRGFLNAKYVITDSFHGCVYSIIFNKPFIAIGNDKRGMTRFTSLLRMFGLEKQLVLRSKDVTDRLIDVEIDWRKVNKVLENYRAKTDSFFSALEI